MARKDREPQGPMDGGKDKENVGRHGGERPPPSPRGPGRGQDLPDDIGRKGGPVPREIPDRDLDPEEEIGRRGGESGGFEREVREPFEGDEKPFGREERHGRDLSEGQGGRNVQP